MALLKFREHAHYSGRAAPLLPRRGGRSYTLFSERCGRKRHRKMTCPHYLPCPSTRSKVVVCAVLDILIIM